MLLLLARPRSGVSPEPPVEWTSPGSRGLLLRGVGGHREVSVETFLLGPAGRETAEPFDVEGPYASVTSAESYWMWGPASALCVEGFQMLGMLATTSVEPFDMQDKTIGVFDEGGVVLPTLGVWVPD